MSLDIRLGTLTENEIAAIVFDAAMKVHKTLGPGLLENAYQQCLAYELKKKNLVVECEKILPLEYDDVILDVGYRIDMLINNSVIVEVKSVESLKEIHLAQVLTYLKLSDCQLGLLINFNSTLIKNGFKRVVNGL